MRHTATSTTFGAAVFRRLMLTALLAAGLALVALPGLASAADPSATPDPTAEPRPHRPDSHTRSDAHPTRTHPDRPTPTPEPTPAGGAAEPDRPTRRRHRRTQPDPSARAGADTDPDAEAPPPPLAPRSMNMFVASGFRYQDPNWAACTATSVRTMLNFIAQAAPAGTGFRWRRPTLEPCATGSLPGSAGTTRWPVATARIRMAGGTR